MLPIFFSLKYIYTELFIRYIVGRAHSNFTARLYWVMVGEGREAELAKQNENKPLRVFDSVWEEGRKIFRKRGKVRENNLRVFDSVWEKGRKIYRKREKVRENNLRVFDFVWEKGRKIYRQREKVRENNLRVFDSVWEKGRKI